MISFSFADVDKCVELVWVGEGCSINKRRMLGYAGKRRTIINSPEYKHFIEDMSWTFRTQARSRPPITDPVLVVIMITRGVRSNRVVDLDAYTKQIIDALQESNIIKNDDQVKDLIIRDAGRNDREDVIMVQVYAIGASHVEVDGKIANGEE